MTKAWLWLSARETDPCRLAERNKRKTAALKRAVQRYFFHILQGRQRTEDRVGNQVADLAHAREMATALATGVFARQLVATGALTSIEVEITTEDGEILGTVMFPSQRD